MSTIIDPINANNTGSAHSKYHLKYSDEKFPGWNYTNMSETLRVAQEVVAGLSDEAIDEILAACGEAELDSLFDLIMEETYSVLFGSKAFQKGIVTSETFGYLDRLSESVKETFRCENLAYFITDVLPEFEMNWHHLEWCDIVMNLRRFAIKAARDHGKSFFFSNAVPIWRLYKYKGKRGKNPAERNPRGFLFSFSIQQAIDLLDILKETVEGSDLLKERLYLKDRWNKTDIYCRNKARLTVKGFGSSVRGAHPGWVIIDDGLKDNVIYSKDQRNKSNNYLLAVVFNMVVPGGDINIVGTPMHGDDYFGELTKKKSWKKAIFTYPAIYPDGHLLWENRWNYAGLMEKRDSQGNLIFSRELLCRPITNESSIFPIEILNNAFFQMDKVCLVHNRESYPIKFHQVVAGCDFAISANVGADYTVFTVWGVDEMGRMWLMFVWRYKGASFGEQMAMLKHINLNFRPDIMVLEDNVFQQIFVEESTKQGLPVVGNTTGAQKNDLKKGWPGMAIRFEQGKYKVPQGDQASKDFSDEMIVEFSAVTFTDDKGLVSTSGHDDICSSTYQATCGVNLLAIGQANTFNYDFL